MCGRFVAAATSDEIADVFDAQLGPDQATSPSWNIAPTRDITTIRVVEGERAVKLHRWGLVPSWAKDPKIGARMINARAETLAEKPAFRSALRRKRCLIPATGFYEWEHIARTKRKQPFYISPNNGELLAFAGLWEYWRPDPERPEFLLSATIITTEANEDISPLHNRMPLILPADKWDQWLDPATQDSSALTELMVTPSPGLLSLVPVSMEVNKVSNHGPHLIDPVDPGEDSELAGGSSG